MSCVQSAPGLLCGCVLLAMNTMFRALQLLAVVPTNACPSLTAAPPTWLPLVSLPLLAMLSMPAPVCRSSGCISSSNFPPYILSPPRPVPVGANSIQTALMTWAAPGFCSAASPHWWAAVQPQSKQSAVGHWYAAECIGVFCMRCSV